MRFRPGAQLDPSQVSDRRGMGAGPIAMGGGGLGVVGVILYLVIALLGGGSSGTFGSLDGVNAGSGTGEGAQLDCTTGADANERQD